jgi:hypothetical protein
VGGDAQDVHGAGAHLHDEQCVEPLQCHGADVEQIRGEQAAGLGLDEPAPWFFRWRPQNLLWPLWRARGWRLGLPKCYWS